MNLSSINCGFLQESENLPAKNNTYDLVSKIAYLIGVPKKFFEREQEMLQMSVYNRLEYDKNARIIRNLCAIRTAIERNFKNINDKIKMEYKTIFSVPEYIPMEHLNQLTEDGVSFVKKTSTKLVNHVIEINRLISDRINNCKNIFPLWVKWEYIRELFIMPGGLSEEGTRAAAEVYYSNLSQYPYKMYIKWEPEEVGNILYNDRKFVSLLYRWHNDTFVELNKVSDAGTHIKGSIYEYIEGSERIVVMVDCENSDPYKLAAVFRNLRSEYTQKIHKIILFDDVHTVDAWRILEQFTTIPVEHMMIERVKQNKSLVDIKLTARACQEHYRNAVDSFIIVSSDSDYWGLISSLPDARFQVMIEREKCSPEMKNALVETNIFYCYIDDFYTGNTDDIKHIALFNEMYRYLNGRGMLNVEEMLDSALRATRIEMSPAERGQFYSRYVRTMQMSISDDGDVIFEFKKNK